MFTVATENHHEIDGGAWEFMNIRGLPKVLKNYKCMLLSLAYCNPIYGW
jgi:hypothetical protein